MKLPAGFFKEGVATALEAYSSNEPVEPAISLGVLLWCCECARDNAIELDAKSLGETWKPEVAFWCAMVEALIELGAYRKETEPQKEGA